MANEKRGFHLNPTDYGRSVRVSTRLYNEGDKVLFILPEENLTLTGYIRLYRLATDGSYYYDIVAEKGVFDNIHQGDIVERVDGTAPKGHKSYYQFPNGVEAWDIARYLDFNCGAAVKYLSRNGRKAEETTDIKEMAIKDLNKAMDHIRDEIVNVLGGRCKYELADE